MSMKGTKKIVALTAYDYTLATLCGEVDILLVGDSAGMIMLGHDTTLPVTMDHMCIFTEAVGRAPGTALVVADMPFLSHQISGRQAIRNAGRLVRAGAGAVKIEGSPDSVRRVTDAGIPVMAHIGLQPQSSPLTEGYSVSGDTPSRAQNLLKEAHSMQEAGAFCIVLEKVATETAQTISGALKIPTIGIGAGASCDGQVLVAHDMLGLYGKKLRFVKRYASLSEHIRKAVSEYRHEVEGGRFPGREHEFAMREES